MPVVGLRQFMIAHPVPDLCGHRLLLGNLEGTPRHALQNGTVTLIMRRCGKVLAEWDQGLAFIIAMNHLFAMVMTEGFTRAG